MSGEQKRKPSRSGGSRRNQGGSRGRSQGSTASSGRRGSKGHGKKATEHRADDHAGAQQHGKKKLPTAAQGLPRHVVEALIRVTPAARRNAALTALAGAAEAFADGQYHAAVRKAQQAKELSSRDATIREVLGLASYRIGDWQQALRELRTYRRLSGETTHMPVEMDVLRALQRFDDVADVWMEFQRLGGSPAAKKEARVVYASHLIDMGRLEEAATVTGTPRVIDDPWPEDLRLWYVAARIASLAGDKPRARRLADAIIVADPGFPGLDELDRAIGGS